MVWRAVLDAPGPGLGDRLLAHEARCRSQRGWVVRWGGRAEQVTPKQFSRAALLPALPGG